jgi:hypothetical protein
MPRPKVTSDRGRLDGVATCEGAGCQFGGPRTRERVRQHVAQTGHITHYVIRDITTYYPPEADRA